MCSFLLSLNRRLTWSFVLSLVHGYCIGANRHHALFVLAGKILTASSPAHSMARWFVWMKRRVCGSLKGDSFGIESRTIRRTILFACKQSSSVGCLSVGAWEIKLKTLQWRARELKTKIISRSVALIDGWRSSGGLKDRNLLASSGHLKSAGHKKSQVLIRLPWWESFVARHYRVHIVS